MKTSFKKIILALLAILTIASLFGKPTFADDALKRVVGSFNTGDTPPVTIDILHQGADDPSPNSLYFLRRSDTPTNIQSIDGVHDYASALATAQAAVTLNKINSPSPSGAAGAGTTPSSNGCEADGTYIGAASASYLLCTISYAIGNSLLRITGFLMWLGGIILNVVISYTVVNISQHLSAQQLPALNLGWAAFRDVANISFIFIILYIAISTILRIGGVDTKKMLATVIVVALLLNFSLFFTKVIIDGTNVLALAFLNKISVNSHLATEGTADDLSNSGLSNAILAPMGLGTLFSVPSSNAADPTTLAQFKNDDYAGVLMVYVFSSGLLAVLGFVFFIAAILFVIRYVVLIFILLLSPLAFAGMALPKTKSMISDKWWKTLFDQALFAPIFFMLMWVVVEIISSGVFAQNITGLATQAGSFTTLFTAGGFSGGVSLFFNYMIIVALVIATMVISKSMASSGGSVVQKLVNNSTGAVGAWAGSVGSFAGRNAVRATGLGYVSNKLADSEFGQTKTGRALSSIAGIGVNAKFGGKTSLKDSYKADKERSEAFAKKSEENRDKREEGLLHTNRVARQEILKGAAGGGLIATKEADAAKARNELVTLQNAKKKLADGDVAGREKAEGEIREKQAQIKSHEDEAEALTKEHTQNAANIAFKTQTGITRGVTTAHEREVQTKRTKEALDSTAHLFVDNASRKAYAALLRKKLAGKTDFKDQLEKLLKEQQKGDENAGGAKK